jgi:hypothetical protein
MSRRFIHLLLAVLFCTAFLDGCTSRSVDRRPTPAQKPPPSLTIVPASQTAGFATVIGRIVLGYADHSPVADLPLWLGTESHGQPVARTNAQGEFILKGLPVGQVINVVDDHLTFQVSITSAGTLDLGTLEYPLIHPPINIGQTPASKLPGATPTAQK